MADMKLFYSTDEVAEHFSVASSKIRYYEKEFKLKVSIHAGNKAFTKKNIEKLAEIISLIDEENYTIQGAKDQLKNKSKRSKTQQEVIDRLLYVRKALMTIKGE